MILGFIPPSREKWDTSHIGGSAARGYALPMDRFLQVLGVWLLTLGGMGTVGLALAGMQIMLDRAPELWALPIVAGIGGALVYWKGTGR